MYYRIYDVLLTHSSARNDCDYDNTRTARTKLPINNNTEVQLRVFTLCDSVAGLISGNSFSCSEMYE